MKQRTSRHLYAYWDSVRSGRLAPNRYEIEPVKIATLLPEIWIAEHEDGVACRLRLAGTRICHWMGRELRGVALPDLLRPDEREAMESMLLNVTQEGAVGIMQVSAGRGDGRRAAFELTMMPLLHGGHRATRIIGCLTPIDPPYWLGTAVLEDFRLDALDLKWPDGAPRLFGSPPGAPEPDPRPPAPGRRPDLAGEARRRFRVVDGGLSDSTP